MASVHSRWIGPKRRIKTSPPRYDDKTFSVIINRYREGDGWHKGARLRKR